MNLHAQFWLLVTVAYCCGNTFNESCVNPMYTLVVHTIPPFHLKSTLHVPHPLKQRNKWSVITILITVYLK